jgi:serine/threonine-protein kinase RsbW
MLLTRNTHQGRPAPTAASGHPSNSFELRLDADPTSVPRARRALVELAERHGADRDAVAIAVSEAVGNALIHGYRDGASGDVVITGEVEDGQLAVTVADEGVGMSPHPDAPGLGLGLPLIGRVADSVEIERPGRGTKLVLRFRIDR